MWEIQRIICPQAEQYYWIVQCANTYLGLTQTRHGFDQRSQSFSRVLHAVQKATTRFQKNTGHVHVASRKIFNTTLQTSQSHNWRGRSKLGKFSNVTTRSHPTLEILVLFEFRLTVKLLFQLGYERRCKVAVHSIQRRCHA